MSKLPMSVKRNCWASLCVMVLLALAFQPGALGQTSSVSVATVGIGNVFVAPPPLSSITNGQTIVYQYTNSTLLTVQAVGDGSTYASFSWTLGAINFGSSFTTNLTVAGNTNLTANFVGLYSLRMAIDSVNKTKGYVSSPETVYSGSKVFTYPSSYEQYNLSGNTVLITAVPSNGYSFVNWIYGTGSGTAADIVPNNASTELTFIPGQTSITLLPVFTNSPVTLTIISTNASGSTVGNPQPPLGSRTFAYNGLVSGVSVTDPDTVSPDSRWKLQGYTSTGSIVPASGSGPLISPFYITTNTTLNWNWAPEYKLTYTNVGSGLGTVVLNDYGSGGWYTNNQVVILTATPASGSSFTGWSGATNTSAPSITITMGSGKSLFANFGPTVVSLVPLTIISTNKNGENVGEPNPTYGTTNMVLGSSIRPTVTSPFVLAPPTERVIATNYTGSGSAPSGVGSSVTSFTITNNSTLQWNWRSQYLLTIEIHGDGAVSRSPGGELYAGATNTLSYWYDDGQVVTLTASMMGGSKYLIWGGDVPVSGSASATLTMSSKKTVSVTFTEQALDSDNDGLPDDWERKFGLDYTKPDASSGKLTDGALGDSGAFGDPDNDGLPNLLEYQITHVLHSNLINGVVECQPNHADSDRDGIDDGYEYRNMLPDNVKVGIPGSQTNSFAVVSPYGVYGPDGNPDGDVLWNTETGYILSNSPLKTIMEYVGPDGIVPGKWDTPTNVVVVNGGGSYTISNVFRKILNPLDTDDQSSSDSSDSEIASFNQYGDGFDDGFEYTWDVWQGQHSGESIKDPLGRTIPQRFGAGPEPTAAAILRINGDTTNDMAVCNYAFDDVCIYLSSNKLQYLQPTRYAVGDGPVAMAKGALKTPSGTEARDLVVVNNLGNSITVMLNDPVAIFTTANYSVGPSPVYAVIGDFNGDTYDDIAVANSGGGGSVTILTNNAAGGFALYTTISGLGTPSCIAAGHVFTMTSTNTTYNDLLVTDSAGSRVLTFSNATAGVFAPGTTVSLVGSPSSIVLGDFDGDGENDFAVTLRNNDVNSLQSWLGQGAGVFAFNQRLWCGEQASPLHLAAGYLDMQLSNDLDVAVATTSNMTGRIFLGSRDGSLTPDSSVTLPGMPVWVALGDINGDGTNDLVFVCRNEHLISMFTGYGDGTMGSFGDLATSLTTVDRRFNPHRMHPVEPDSGKADYDLIYKPTGGVGGWFTDSLEYHAWDIGLYSNLIKRTEYPNLPRCTNPFKWDTDNDGMPDGWEIVFGYDPWNRRTFSGFDGDGNPDGDKYAQKGNLIHKQVYDSLYGPGTLAYHDFNPGMGWSAGAAFNNRMEMLGGRPVPAVVPNDPDDRSTSPLLRDTDTDGMWDGWEHYVGLNPIDGADGGADSDGDGLSNVQEFLCQGTLMGDGWTISNGVLSVIGNLPAAQVAAIQARIEFVAGWRNKTAATDPYDGDTDSDQIPDGAERSAFNYFGVVATPVVSAATTDQLLTVSATWLGSGLSPTSADTDGDFLPDYWEYSFNGSVGTNGLVEGGMDGSSPDAYKDYDGDGLYNFQEYMTGAVPHWQYKNNNDEYLWTPGLGIYGYDPYNFFDETLSTTVAEPYGSAMTSYGGRRTKYWDPHSFTPSPFATPFTFLTAAEPAGGARLFSTTDPRSNDTDWDSMDDYWEIYHMLNPCRGWRDLVSAKIAGVQYAYEEFTFDVQQYPWVNGDWETDSDQDGLPNVYESIQSISPSPQYYHTDPSPYWMSDISYDQSWVNLYYWSGFNFGINQYFYWFQPYVAILGDAAFPQYLFDFEMNEGFDTDNDMIGDYAELVSNSSKPGRTDPLDAGDPIRRRALYLNGNAAARTIFGTHHEWEQLRTFTIEAWVRPANPLSGVEQVIAERPAFVKNGNPMGYPSGIRVNFRLGLDANGCPFIGYNGGGYTPIFQEAKAGITMALKANQWAHLAGVYDGAKDKLFLYVNGQMAAMIESREIPFNGNFGPPPAGQASDPFQYKFSMPVVLGARENNPDGEVNGSTILATSLAGLSFTQPSLDRQYTGWLDEVRIWSGARSQSDIRGNMLRRFTMQDVTELNTTLASEAQLLYCYGFDDLADPDHSGVAPAGFELLTGYPNVGTPYSAINWWATANDRSRVYNEYRYLPWVKNLSSHAPMNHPSDSRFKTGITNSVVVNGVLTNVVTYFPNTSNPYTFQYRTQVSATNVTEAHPYLLASDGLYGDLLPLNWAQGDEDVAMWDNGTVPSITPYDSDGDGMSDDWEMANGLDPRDATGENGAEGDPDGDGLNNFQEYLCGTDPWNTSTGSSGIPDGEQDADGDHLVNLKEFQRGTLPNVKDTDDDGLTDWEEVMGQVDTVWALTRPATSRNPTTTSDPLNALSPAIQRSVYLNGTARLVVPPNDKLMSTNYTVEAWIRPDTNSTGGVIISRYMDGMVPGQYGLNYELGLTTNSPAGTVRLYTRFGIANSNILTEMRLDGTGVSDHTNGLAGVAISKAGVWTHVAGVYDSYSNRMSLYVNGKLAAYRQDIGNYPPTVFGYASTHWGDEVTIGASRSTGAVTNGFKGYVDNVRIWSLVRSSDEIADRYNAPEGQPLDANGNVITLKNGAVYTHGGLSAEVSLLAASQPVRMLVKFDSEDFAKNTTVLTQAGMTVLNYVAPGVRAVKATTAQLTSLGSRVKWTGLLKSSDKIASLLNATGTNAARNVLVSFFKDVPVQEALQVVQAVGGTVYKNRYIGGADLVAMVDDQQLLAMAANNAVSWIRPAAAFLTSGGPVYRLDDHMVGGAEKAPFAVNGDGWDGPGRGSADLTYHFVNYNSNLDPTVSKRAVVDAMFRWAKYAALTFTEIGTSGNSFSMDINWETIDGPSGILGQGYFPNDINPEPIAGDFRLDSEETWKDGLEGTGIDLQYVATHEEGHCLGIDHSDDPSAVMYPFYDGTRDATLAQDDIDAILAIYGNAIVKGQLAQFRFDDGGRTAEDSTVKTNWLQNWNAAAILTNGAVFSTNTVAPLDKDSDGDGLPDWWEMGNSLDPYDDGITGSNTNNNFNGAEGDPDLDGLSNLDEYYTGTNPWLADTDGDGISDYDEDSDGDGLSNGDEIDVFGSNPSLVDTDDDGYPDGVEASNLLPDPADAFGVYRKMTGPADSLSPSIPRSFLLTGKAVTAPNGDDLYRFALLSPETAADPPHVTITAPVDNANIAVRFVLVEGVITSAVPLQSVRLYDNGLFVKELGTSSSFSETIIIYSGTNTIEVRATDLDGNEGSDNVKVNGTFPIADIRVTQTWDVPGDLDTWLIDPLGRHMGWIPSGPGYPTNVAAVMPHATLDIDDVVGIGPENITLAAPYSTNGNYEVWMNNFGNSGNPNSTVRVLVLEGRPGQKYVEFGPQPMPTSDANGSDPQAWWHVTTIHMPDGTMTPPGTPVDTGNTGTNVDTGVVSLDGWTIEGWIKPGATAQTGAIARYMQKDGRIGYVVGLSNNCPFVKMGLASGASYRISAGALPANEWTHVAYVYCSTHNSLRIYLNGNFTVAQQVLESRSTGAGDLTIDTYAESVGQVFTDCKVDELRFWSKARNGGSIRDVMNKVVTPSSSLVACYRFDDGGLGIEDAAYSANRNYDLGGVLPDVLKDAKPGPDGVWGTGDDVAAGAGADKHNDYVTCRDAAPVDALVDTDKDGMPDWWESTFGGLLGLDPGDDPDGDGLNNLNEYYANTNPKDADSDGDGVLDGDEDADADGLSNAEEQEAGSDPLLPDTDDDGISDAVEIASRTSPINSLSPLRDRVLSLNGSVGSYVAMPDLSRLMLTNWTIGAWICPNTLGTDMEIISRSVQTNAFNYYLGLAADGRVTAKFTPGDLSSDVAVSSTVRVFAGTWTHVAASYSAVSNKLTVYVNGCENGQVTSAKSPKKSGIGPVRGRVGAGFNGQIEEVAAYAEVIGEAALKVDMKGLAMHELGGSYPAPVSYYRFDDGTASGGTSGRPAWSTGQVQDFAPGISADWLNRWRNGGTLVGGATITLAAGNAPVQYTTLDSDGDGMPDWWENANGLNAFSATGPDGADADPDGDGLSNLGEYLSGTDPLDGDTDNNGIRDGDDDADGDKLANRLEILHGTLPNNKDTDDDGVSDYEEITGVKDSAYDAIRPATSCAPVGISDPLNALSPYVARSMKFNGNARVIVPPADKLMSEDWSVELWVNPPTNSRGGVLLSRYVGGLATGQSGINYELGLTTNGMSGALRPYVRYASTTASVETEIRVNGTGSSENTNLLVLARVPTNAWTHLAGVYNAASNTLSLYVNGLLASYRTDAVMVPPTVFGTGTNHWRDEVTIGASRSTGAVTNGFDGVLDEVRIWKTSIPAINIWERYNAPDGIPGELKKSATIHLVNRVVIPEAGISAPLQTLPDGVAVRALVVFSTEAAAADKAGIEAAGGRVVAYVGKKTRMVKATKTQLAALGGKLVSALTITPADKISRKLGVGGSTVPRNMLVNFYSDVSAAAAAQAVVSAGGAVTGTGYIGGTYLVASLNDSQAVALAADDGVAWLMPAAAFLTDGSSYKYLPDHMVQGLVVAPFAVNGEGWDGPGRGSATLTYHYVNDTTKLPPAEARAAVTAQLIKWSEVAAITFSETNQAGLDKSFDIGWYKGEHGDGSPFDGPSGVLGHGFYPNDINPEPIAGDFHLDEDETWKIGMGGSGIDIEYVALHEMGHCLGMAHSDDTTALMYPFYDGTRGAILAQDDIDGIRSIYGEGGGGPTPGPTPTPTYPPLEMLSEFRFDDGGLTAQDFAIKTNWLQNWNAAAVLTNGAVFYTNSVAPLDKDSDGDGLPDWWEIAYGLDPYDSQELNGTDGDMDGDGLTNINEYWSGTDPRIADTDEDGIGDGFEDSDGDGLSNIQEQQLGSRPDLKDTDDDGIMDGLEATTPNQSVTNALSPLIDRVLNVSGGGYVDSPNDVRFSVGSWTVGAWVQPTNLTAATVVGHQVASNAWNYNLSISAAGRVIALFTPGDLTANVAVTSTVSVVTGAWTHVAGSFDGSSGRLSVYVNGLMRGAVNTAKRPAVSGTGPAWTRIGQGLNGRMDEVAIYSNSLSAGTLQETMAGVNTVTNVVPACYYRFDDGTSASGTSGKAAWSRGQVQDFGAGIRLDDWNTGWTNAGTLVGGAVMAVAPTNAPVLYALMDSDRDGLPDWWELVNGLDPHDGTGNNGGAGDIDNDGLSNLGEYLAGTDPRAWDTDGDGFSDYDSRSGPGARTWGELYDDGDGIPDLWEIRYRGLCATTGKRGLDPANYDANLDPDEDGWDNYSEYLAGTDPLVNTSFPSPTINLALRYNGARGATIMQAMGGSSNSMIRVHFFHKPAMDGYPDAVMTLNSDSFTGKVGTSNSYDHVWQGANYIFAWLDVNGNGSWDTEDEPAGIAQFQPINIGWGSLNAIEIGLTDRMAGYPRFSWPATNNVVEYEVRCSSPLFRLTMRSPSTTFHEGQWLATGNYGVGTNNGTTYLIYTDGSYYTDVVLISFPKASSLVAGEIVTPAGTTFQYARNDLLFRVDTNATAYRLQIAATSNGTPIVTTQGIAPYRDITGTRKVMLPLYAGDNYGVGGGYASNKWANGLYWARVQGFTPSTPSGYSPWTPFLLDIKSPALGGKSTISGDIYYLGKVGHGYGAGQTSNLTVIVQAYQSLGFSGVADGQVQVTYTCNTNVPSINKGSYTLVGLESVPYFVRAFIDVNGNRQLDTWEPMGFAQEVTSNGYQSVAIDLTGQGASAVDNIRIVIRDRDTDDDAIPDGWEWMYYGTLANMSSNIAANGMSLLRNYEIEPMDLDPTKTDYDADGVSDVDEITYGDRLAGRTPDINHYDPYDPVTNPNGTDLNPTKWDTDGDGLSDGYELDHKLNPLDPSDAAAEIARASVAGETIPGAPAVYQVATVTPDAGQFSLSWLGQIGMAYEVQYSDDLKTWQLAPSGDRYGAAVHTYVDDSPKVASRFYRVVVK